MKQKFREMQSHMQNQMSQQQDFANASADAKPSSKISKEDYIDFEEIK